ncbi:MAG: M1 family metallopeptidase [Gemmatimonadaceae bacterium]
MTVCATLHAAAAYAGVLLLAAPPSAGMAQSSDAHTYQPGIDIVDYSLHYDLPREGHRIAGRAELAVRRTAATDSLILDLIRLRVDSVLVAGRPEAFHRDSATIRIPLRVSLADSFTVAIRFHGEVEDGLIIRTDSLGRWMAFGDNWPDRARHWIPSVDHPSDKATVTWTVRAPGERRVVANGSLAQEAPITGEDGDGWTITTWRESRPIPTYLMVFAAAPLAFHDLGPSACGESEFPGCVRQSVYVFPEALDFLPGPFRHADGIVEFFVDMVAPFPYEKLAHLQSATRFGGMENASAIFYGDRGFRERTMGPGLIAHETAHQWFGNSVTEREWAHLWLSEGFATYFEKLWVERFQGDSVFRAAMSEIRTQIEKSPATALRPVIDTAQANLLALLNTNSYQKGAWTLHMLRSLVGDSAFFAGVRSYYAANSHGTALTSDLVVAMEAASGQELDWFFDQWLRRPGVAELTTSWSYDRDSGRVILDLAQGGAFAPYRFPLTVELRGASGGIQRVTVDVAAEREVRIPLPIDVPEQPVAVVLDPDVELLATFSTGKPWSQ